MRTVVVRILEPAPGTGEVDLHGFVDDVSQGTTERFAGRTQLLHTIEWMVHQSPDERRELAASATDPEKTHGS